MNIIGTGLSGLVGSRVTELLRGSHEFTNLSLETGVDITDRETVGRIIGQSGAPWVFHFAAKTDVDGCEADRVLGENGTAWKVNANATAGLADICRFYGKHLLYISTDYVFAGSRGHYTEDDRPDPQGWYGITKYEGEKAVRQLGATGLVLRIANPYRAGWIGKKDFVHRILDRLRNGQSVAAPADGEYTLTYIDDIARAIDALVAVNACGIYHVVGDYMTQYEGACLIARKFGLDASVITKTTFAEFFKNRAPRPVHASLENAKIIAQGIKMSAFGDGLSAVVSQEENPL